MPDNLDWYVAAGDAAMKANVTGGWPTILCGLFVIGSAQLQPVGAVEAGVIDPNA